ncbi:MAG: SURF1 family protein [Rhodoglobus sp.]
MSTTVWQVARRPRWIAALLLALAVASGFAALGQWQLARSVEGGQVTEQQTEASVPLTSIATPQKPMPAETIGQRVTVGEVEWVAGDYVVLSDRTNDAEPGYWVVAHAITGNGASLAVALGWVASAEAAASAARGLDDTPPASTLTGRYLPTESPQQSDFEAGQRSALATAELVNLWGTVPDGVYSGYVISDDAPAGLEQIDSPPPNTEISLNLLNIFYAIEWVIFAGFAIFLWYRLVKDAWEEENAPDTAAALDLPTVD